MLGTKLIIVFGISGVGKTTTCAEYAQSREGVVHFSASNLLRLHRDTAGTRSIDDVMGGQILLIDSVRACRTVTSAKLMLLDAHSLLIADGKDFVIPVDIIAAMEPNGLIFVEAAAEVISRRRTSRGDRGNSISDEITRLQAVALQAVKEYSKSLECPLYIVDADQRVDFARAMEGLS